MRDIALISASKTRTFPVCHLYVMKALNLSGNAHVCEFTRWRFSRLLVMEPAKCQCECKVLGCPPSA